MLNTVLSFTCPSSEEGSRTRDVFVFRENSDQENSRLEVKTIDSVTMNKECHESGIPQQHNEIHHIESLAAPCVSAFTSLTEQKSTPMC